MPKAIAIIRQDSSGGPDIGNDWRRWVLIGELPGNRALYLIVGSGPQLIAIGNHDNTVFGMQVTGAERWNELDEPVPTALRNKINAYRQSQGQNNIPAGTTLFQVMRAANAEFEWGLTDVWDGDD